jgi:hypothetical protein
MQTRLATDWGADHQETEESSSPRVTVLFEDVAAGLHAMRVLARIVHEPNDEFRPQLWRFDLLDDPDWFSIALADAMTADIILITTTSNRALNPSVEKWINLCLTRKRGTSTAVVALLGPAENLDGPKSPRFQWLERAARDAELDFFAPQSPREPHSPATVQSRRREMNIPRQPIDSYQPWGINE